MITQSFLFFLQGLDQGDRPVQALLLFLTLNPTSYCNESLIYHAGLLWAQGLDQGDRPVQALLEDANVWSMSRWAV